MHPPQPAAGLEEMLLLLKHEYGYDFSGYSKASLRRRFNRIFEIFNLSGPDEFRARLRENKKFIDQVVIELTVTVTEMFRNPKFFQALRTEVLPQLKTHPFLKIWNAGCSTGEEIYSLAVMLAEEELFDRATIYATDINPKVLEQAKDGIFPLQNLQQYTQNHQKSGGKSSLTEYFRTAYGSAIFLRNLKQNMAFQLHNLVSDGSFNEFNLIICRNVLIYFEPRLQNRVFNLFLESLPIYGYLALGSKESLIFCENKDKFETINAEQKIYRRIR